MADRAGLRRRIRTDPLGHRCRAATWSIRRTGMLATPQVAGRSTVGGGSVHRGRVGSAQCDNVVPLNEDEAPSLLNECRGADWYLVHPDNSPATTFAYRLGDPFTGDSVVRRQTTRRTIPTAVYGEILVPAGTDEVGYADDFNARSTRNTRPEACGGPAAPTTPPTTAAPTTPTEPPTTGPAGSVIRNLSVHRWRGLRRCRVGDRPRCGNLRCGGLRPRRAGHGDAALDPSWVGDGDRRCQRQRQHHLRGAGQ